MSDLLDHCSLIGARRLADRITAYWRGRGFNSIKTWVEHTGLPVVPSVWSFQAPHYTVKSNIQADGFPPGLPA